MGRLIETHKVNGVNDGLLIEAIDEPGAGGANHVYRVEGPGFGFQINFQNGPIAEAGINGLTHEVLLAIVADRLAGFQSGKYACEENADALAHVEAANAALLARTQKRAERGVEGTSTL